MSVSDDHEVIEVVVQVHFPVDVPNNEKNEGSGQEVGLTGLTVIINDDDHLRRRQRSGSCQTTTSSRSDRNRRKRPVEETTLNETWC
mgnify:FL=1